MPDAQCTRSLACEINKAHEHSHHGHTGFTRHSPRNGFTAYFVLSRRSGLFVTVISRVFSQDLTPASRRQNHTTSPSTSSAGRLTALSASTASRPASVTIARAPLSWDGTARISELIWVRREQKYFCKGGWTGKSHDRPPGKSADLRETKPSVAVTFVPGSRFAHPG